MHPLIGIRWSPSSSSDTRSQVLANYELTPVETDGDSVRVRMSKHSPERLRSLINEPVCRGHGRNRTCQRRASAFVLAQQDEAGLRGALATDTHTSQPRRSGSRHRTRRGSLLPSPDCDGCHGATHGSTAAWNDQCACDRGICRICIRGRLRDAAARVYSQGLRRSRASSHRIRLLPGMDVAGTFQLRWSCARPNGCPGTHGRPHGRCCSRRAVHQPTHLERLGARAHVIAAATPLRRSTSALLPSTRGIRTGVPAAV